MNVPKHIQNLEPYKPGKSIRDAAKEFGITTWIKLASNENPLGVSTKAKEAALKAITEANLYPHPKSPELTQAIAKKFGRLEEEIFCANGIDAIIGYTIMAFTNPEDEILTSEGSFIGIYVNTHKLGRRLRAIPLKNYAYDLDSIAKAVTPTTKIIYLANPNNPTGTSFEKSQWEAFFNRLPDHVLVMLDEAYYEYACDDPLYPNGLNYALDRLIVTRTFSKAYGMANFRVGYAFSHPQIIAELQKVKLPFEPSGVSSIAAAAAITDDDFLKKTQKLNKDGIDFFTQEFKKLGIDFVGKTHGNFLMLVLKNEKEAAHFNESCLKSGLIVRPLTAFGLPHCIRINTGSHQENEKAIEIIKKIFQQRKTI